MLVGMYHFSIFIWMRMFWNIKYSSTVWHAGPFDTLAAFEYISVALLDTSIFVLFYFFKWYNGNNGGYRIKESDLEMHQNGRIEKGNGLAATEMERSVDEVKPA